MGESRKARWMRGFDELVRFSAENGHAPVPRTYVSGNGFRLGEWVNRNRQGFRSGKLSADRIAMLEEVPGWSWTPGDNGWLQTYTALLECVNRNGHAYVTEQSVSPDGFAIGARVHEIRRKYRAGKLPRQQVRLLEELPGWSWTPQGRGWLQTYTALLEYADCNGHCDVPASFVRDDGFTLGRRVARLRRRYRAGTLPAGLAQALERLPGWTWEPGSTRWDEAVAELHRFSAEHGHALVPRQFVSASGFNLGFWVNRHRRSYRAGTMPAQLVAMLEAVPGWAWSNPRDTWDEGFDALCAFAAEHGHCRVPKEWSAPSGFRLGWWVEQRRRERHEGRLPHARAAALESVAGWAWSPSESNWQRTIDGLTAFADAFGHTRVPSGWVGPDGFRLGSRVQYLRKSHADGKLSHDRAQRLEKFPGWAWLDNRDWWRSGYDELRRYVDENGTADVPYRLVADSGFGLGKWVDRCRFKHRRGDLPAELVERLEAMPGWHWSRRENRWQTGLAELKAYVAEHATARVPGSFTSASGFALGTWVKSRKAQHYSGTLAAERAAELEALPGWRWWSSR